jgi:hypothetical protein
MRERNSHLPRCANPPGGATESCAFRVEEMTMIDLERVRLRIVDGLPEHVCWYVKGNSLDSHFHRARQDLRPIGGDDLNGFEIPP